MATTGGRPLPDSRTPRLPGPPGGAPYFLASLGQEAQCVSESSRESRLYENGTKALSHAVAERQEKTRFQTNLRLVVRTLTLISFQTGPWVVGEDSRLISACPDNLRPHLNHFML